MTFFRVDKINHKWYLLTPDGKPFFMRGANHYGNGEKLPLNGRELYPHRKAWRDSVIKNHRDWGFNYLPPSIGPSEVDPEPVPPVRNHNGKTKPAGQGGRTPEWSADDFAEANMPFTALLGVPKQYMAGPGMPDVFSRAFRDEVDQRCRGFCEPLKDNPQLIGYHFCHNPPWHPLGDAFFDWVHQIVDDGREAKQVWARLMKQIYGTVDRWRETYSVPIEHLDEVANLPFPLNGKNSATNLARDKCAFMKRVCREWYRVYSETIRKYDPNHLILGDRNTLHLQPLSDWAIEIMEPFIDVLSINVMGPSSIALREMEQVTCHWDGPIHIADTGAGVYNGKWPKATFMCKNIDEFGEVYGGYLQLGLEHPQVIGLGWCGYYETCSSRCGLVDCRNDEPMAEKVDQIKRLNAAFDLRYAADLTP